MSDQSNDQIITDFCDAWTAGDVAAVMGAFADDAVYHNIPMAPLVGKEAIAGFIEPFLAPGKAIFETHHQVASGSIVMNERTDTIVSREGSVTLPVMGVFELADGKITAWRDYFDLAMFRG